jgi:hypothetical protein
MNFDQLAGCKNGSCPKIFQVGDRVLVQGYLIADVEAADAGHRQAVVAIPLGILAEAALTLTGSLDDASLASRGDAGRGGPRVSSRGDRVVARGDAGTKLTRQLQPGPGEAVVEIPSVALAEAIRELVPA